MRDPSNRKMWANGSNIDLSTSEQHRLLAAEQRRLVLEILEDESLPFGLKGLATEVAAREAENDTANEETVRRVLISLHHTHLPALDDAGILTYDPESHRIESGR